MKTALYWILGIIAFVAASVLIMVYGFGMTWLGIKLDLPLQNAQTEVIRATNQYRTTQNQHLAAEMQAYEDAANNEAHDAGDPTALAADRAQEKALLRKMNGEVSAMDAGTVSPEITKFLTDHPANAGN